MLTCVNMNYELKWDNMDIGTFHYLKVAKSIPWTVSSCWPSEWALLQSYFRCYGFGIELPAILHFVCQLDASWGCWAGKCCYSCLFCMLEQWLWHLHSFKYPYLIRIIFQQIYLTHRWNPNRYSHGMMVSKLDKQTIVSLILTRCPIHLVPN